MLDIFLRNSSQLLPRYQQTVDKINTLEPEIKKLTKKQLRQKVDELKRNLQKGDNLMTLL